MNWVAFVYVLIKLFLEHLHRFEHPLPPLFLKY